MTTSERNAAYYVANKAKVIAATRARKAADPERKREQDRAWARANPGYNKIRKLRRRTREATGTISVNIIETLWREQGGKCPVCLAELSDTGYHVDHVMPLALDGVNEDINLQLLCPPCNRSKRAKHPLDFLKERGLL